MVSRYSAVLRLGRVLNNGAAAAAAGAGVQEPLQPKVQVEYPLNVPVLISAELAAPRRGISAISQEGGRGREHGRAKKPGKLVPRPRELRGDFGRKSAASGWCLVLAGHPVHTRRTCRGLLRGELLVGLISLSSVRSHSPLANASARTRLGPRYVPRLGVNG